MIIPNCKGISNNLLCKLLSSNPSLLTLDISNKQDPFIDQTVVTTIAQSCQCLTVLKLSDYQLEDPNDLLGLCGKAVVTKASHSPVNLSENSVNEMLDTEHSPLNSDLTNGQTETEEIADRVTNILHLDDLDTGCTEAVPSDVGACSCEDASSEYVETLSNERKVPVSVKIENTIEDRKWEDQRDDLVSTREEAENQRSKNVSGNASDAESDADPVNGENDLYEDDASVWPLEVQDHSGGIGCLELVTLWLENVNLTDQVAAVLLQTLLHLRDVNFSGTDICNPWRLVDRGCAKHFRHLEELDVTSTALSRSAVQLIPEFHPDLRKLSISSTTLPPPTYRNISKLSGLGDLQLIGGQFYPCEPDEIFVNGILPAVSGVGRHLESLNLTFFAHVELSKIALSCPLIKHLDLSHTDIFITLPCSSLGEHCPNLTSLNLSHAHIEARDPSTMKIASEDQAIHKMIGSPRTLEEVHLCGLKISSQGVRMLFPDDKYSLKFLDISFCKILTISGVRHLWKVCPLLTRIDMIQCKDISVNDCKTFAEHCNESRPVFKSEGTLYWKYS